MIQSTDYAAVDQLIGMYIEPDAIHIMHKSEFSELYGDYSSFSDEFDSVPGTEGLDESEEQSDSSASEGGIEA
jgi:spermidine/putrescine transport system ATP-binding protein